MPLTRFKLSAIGDGGITSAKLADNIELSGTEAARVPNGTTAQRANPQTGDLRFNTTLDQLEQYTNDSGWQGISPPPVITSVDVDNLDGADDPQTIVVTGSNFDNSAVGVLIDANGSTLTPTSSTRNSSTQLTIVFSGGDTLDGTTPEPLDVRVTNGSGLTATLEDSINIDAIPVWSTSAGSLGTAYVDEAISTITLSATDPEGESVTYSVTSGSLPSGLSLNSANGEITGTPTATSTNYSNSGTTENFTVSADDGTGNVTPRAFSILKKWYDGSSSALAARSVRDIYLDTDGSAVDGTPSQYYLDPTGSGSSFQVYGVDQISSLGTIPSGTTNHFKNLRGLNVVTYNNFDRDNPNEDQYLISTGQFDDVMEGLHGIRASGYTGSIYWAVFAAGTLVMITRTHMQVTHQQFLDGMTGGETDADPANWGADPAYADLEYMAGRTYWDVWDENYTVSNYNGLKRVVPYRSTSALYSSPTSYGLHFKRKDAGEHYPWRGNAGDTLPSTDYMTSGGYRYGEGGVTDAQAIAAGSITTGSHYSADGGAPATSKSFENGAADDDYAGVQLKHYIFLHEGTDDS